MRQLIYHYVKYNAIRAAGNKVTIYVNRYEGKHLGQYHLGQYINKN